MNPVTLAAMLLVLAATGLVTSVPLLSSVAGDGDSNQFWEEFTDAESPAISPDGAGPALQEGPSLSLEPEDLVPFSWTVYRSPESGEGLLILQGGTIHALPSMVQIVDGTGGIVASAPATPVIGAPQVCPSLTGIVRAELSLREEHYELFAQEWPAGYRIEVLVGGFWRPTSLVFLGC